MPPLGNLEVLLVDAHGLHNTEFLSKMDPYVFLKYQTQEHKSKVASNEGSNPEWNETFVFKLSEGASDLLIRILDKDRFSADDFLGEAIIPLKGVLTEGSILPTPYNVVLMDKTYCGQIKVGLTFTPKAKCYVEEEEEEVEGGWKEGSL
ncbi:elicitor-responsive protein 3 isoform X2 [Cryptomeria japonica]|uniref:elicitor-responsive protein 3 isoform X2 n=1 Tax=Cryptomeria japonica TaxID=3369 RepID=UPI0027DA35D1|nr:elicitor-responsive protein 3 isoform X2 [Cryptomeria japonica]